MLARLHESAAQRRVPVVGRRDHHRVEAGGVVEQPAEIGKQPGLDVLLADNFHGLGELLLIHVAECDNVAAILQALVEQRVRAVAGTDKRDAQIQFCGGCFRRACVPPPPRVHLVAGQMLPQPRARCL